MTRSHVLCGWIGASAVLVCVGSVGPWWSGFDGLDQDGLFTLVAGAGALALLVAYVAVPWHPRPRWPLVAIVAAGIVAGAVGVDHLWRIEFGDIRAFRNDVEEAGIDLGGLGPRWGLVLMMLASVSLTVAALVALLTLRRPATALAGAASVHPAVVYGSSGATERRVDPVTGAALASWPRRAAGGLVDALVVLVLLSIVVVVVALTEAFSNPETDDISDTSLLILVLAIFLLPPLYQWLLIGRWGQTIGKMAVGVKVLRSDDAGRVSYPRALQRALAFEVLGIVPFLLVVAFLWPLWDDRCQALYDKMAGTIVVRLRGHD